MIGGGGREADQRDNGFTLCVYMYVQCVCRDVCGSMCGCFKANEFMGR